MRRFLSPLWFIALLLFAGCYFVDSTGTPPDPEPCSEENCPETNDECSESECGPAPLAPNILCDDGSIGGPGPCLRDEDGVCGWTFRDCPT